jgi:hypothetical protein
MEGDSLLQEVPTGVRRKYLLQGFLAGVLCMLVLVVGFLVLSGGHVEYGEHAKATVGTDSEYLESTTGVIFPISMKPPADSEHEYKILGAGPRIKKIGPIGVKVYGVAMYAETKSAKDALKSYAGKSAEALQNDAGFYSALQKGSFNKVIDIRMKRGVGRDTMVNALVEALEPRVQTLQPERADELVQKFEALFTDKGFKEGDIIQIQEVGKSLYLSVNGDKRPPIYNEKTLADAFFGIYTDDNAVSPAAKERLVDGVPGLLK